MKVLVVDDDELNRKILTSILEDAKFEVVEAQDGVVALEQMEQHSDIQIILLDRMMPRMNGMEFMEEFKKRPDWEGKKVIMQTAANQPKDVIEGNKTGVYYYLSKPFDDEIVMSVVRAACDDINKDKDLQTG